MLAENVRVRAGELASLLDPVDGPAEANARALIERLGQLRSTWRLSGESLRACRARGGMGRERVGPFRQAAVSAPYGKVEAAGLLCCVAS